MTRHVDMCVCVHLRTTRVLLATWCRDGVLRCRYTSTGGVMRGLACTVHPLLFVRAQVPNNNDAFKNFLLGDPDREVCIHDMCSRRVL